MSRLLLFAALAGCGNYLEYGPDDGYVPSDDDVTDVVHDSMPVDADLRCVSGENTTPGECDPLTQEPCPATERCAWIWYSLEDPGTEPIEPAVGYLGCVCDGELGVGEPCVRSGPSIEGEAGIGAGVSDHCVRGSQCVDGMCRTICDTLGAEPSCPSGETCVNVPDAFVSMGMTVAGVCR